MLAVHSGQTAVHLVSVALVVVVVVVVLDTGWLRCCLLTRLWTRRRVPVLLPPSFDLVVLGALGTLMKVGQLNKRILFIHEIGNLAMYPTYHEDPLLHDLQLRDELLLLDLQLLQRGRGRRRRDLVLRLLARLHHVRLLKEVDLKLLLNLLHQLLKLLAAGLGQLLQTKIGEN